MDIKVTCRLLFGLDFFQAKWFLNPNTNTKSFATTSQLLAAESETAMARVTGIKTTYIICENGDTTTTTLQNFDASNDDVSEVRVGLPIGVEPVKVRFDPLF